MRTKAVLVLILAVGAFAAQLPLIHVRNLGRVNDHLLRGAQPDAVALEELGSSGVTLVIDLREAGKATQFEQEQTRKLGIRYVNIPFPPLSAPSQDQVAAVLKLLAENNSQTVFLHCHRGKDRTGTVVACYRIQHDGWSNDRALAEAKQYGMSPAERGMRSFVAHFTPTSLANHSAAPIQP